MDTRAERIGQRLNQTKSESFQGDKEQDEGQGEDKDKIKGRPSLTMYLPEDLYKRLNTRYLELQLRGSKDDIELQKNKDFYPKVVEIGLDHLNDEDVLE